MKRPRPFSHSPIYINDRKSRLAEVEQRARRELGLSTPDDGNSENLRGVFKSVQKHRKGTGMRWDSLKLLLFVFVLIVILLTLL